MEKKIIVYAVSVLLLTALFGCGSGGYKIEQGNYPDTTYKSTGAKLKGTYRIRSAPRLTLQLIGGFNLGMAELSSNYSNVFDANQFIEGQNFGVKNGLGVMLTGKIALHRQGNVRLNISAGYNRFVSNLFSKDSPFGDVGYNVLTFGIGLENCFAPTLKLKPYIAGELQANLISGKANINDVNNNTARNVKIKNSLRIGYMFNSGLEYMLNNQVGLNLGLKVTNANQILKKSAKTDNPDEVPLRDEKVNAPDYPIEFGGFKNFTFTTFYVGVNLYFGIKDILYKF
jgi:hypothetical protein